MSLLLGGLLSPAQATDLIVSGSVGAMTLPHGPGGVDDYRVAVGWVLPWQWWDNDVGVLQTRAELVGGYTRTHVDPVWSLIAAPVLHYQFKTARPDSGPFVELSVGVAVINNTQWSATRDLNTHWQFADRAGIGYALGRHELSVNYLHFSNADLSKPNPGGDVANLRYSYRF
ncbi:acyloxyacyl hydrolase [Neisseriaceae bacterium JH1-16]|nr:acyloxyacyl hydrolase [Neisseriaceae bacterium JH1-16]